MGATPGWATSNQELTDWLASEPKNSARKRNHIGAFFLRDLLPKIVQAAHSLHVSAEEISLWLSEFFSSHLQEMSSISLFKEVYEDKHLDRTGKWKGNDLQDMMYLCCGAGYADYVVGEKSLVSRIRQAARRTDKAINIFPNLSGLMSNFQGGARQASDCQPESSD